MSVNELLFELNVDNVNLFALCRFILQSEIWKKLNGFVEKYPVPTDDMDSDFSSQLSRIPRINKQHGSDVDAAEEEEAFLSNVRLTNTLLSVCSFLEALSNPDQDGKIVVERVFHPTRTESPAHAKSHIRFVLLNPSQYMDPLVRSCRSLILVGGTMQPFDALLSQLFTPLTGLSVSTQIHCVSLPHVVDAQQSVCAVSLGAGPTGVPLDFTFQKRKDANMIEELGRVIVNVVTLVPDGVVVFFTSYSFEEMVMNMWQKSGILKRIEAKKKLFREQRNGSSEQLLAAYAAHIHASSTTTSSSSSSPPPTCGAVLSAIVGGSLSEGINFSDGLCRCVVVVGMPYPNANDVELAEKMKFCERLMPNGGRMYYESLCMRAVNQSIGRSIRHGGDYSAMLLLDTRYARPTVVQGVSTWIRNSLSHHPTFPPAFVRLRQFFASKKSNVESQPKMYLTNSFTR